jgi:hypothetical protein
MMEAELVKAGLLGDTASGIDVEAFIERYLEVPLDQHATDLEPGVLGLTEFFSDGTCKIKINRSLSDEVDRDDSCPPGIKGRWRATMAHDASHVVMHKGLFVGGAKQTSLFDTQGPPRSQKLLRCSSEDLARTVRSGPAQADPEEVQANMGMAALLMPRSVFRVAAEEEIQRVNNGAKMLAHADPREWMVVRALATRFQVSKQATSIRLQTLGLVLRPGERTLV